jgi:hypothetical protein
MGRARADLTRNALASLGVVALLAAIGLGLPRVDARVRATYSVPGGLPFEVTDNVTVVPPPGAQYDATQTATSQNGREGGVLFVVGSARLTVSVTRFDGSLAQAARQTRETITKARGYQALGREGPTATSAGVPGLGGGYTAANGPGWYAVFVHDDLSVRATFAGTDLPGSNQLEALRASVASIAFKAG